MIRIRPKNPMILMTIGMLCLSFALAWPQVLHLPVHFGLDLTDGLRGMLFGVAFGLNLLAARLTARGRRWGG